MKLISSFETFIIYAIFIYHYFQMYIVRQNKHVTSQKYNSNSTISTHYIIYLFYLSNIFNIATLIIPLISGYEERV